MINTCPSRNYCIYGCPPFLPSHLYHAGWRRRQGPLWSRPFKTTATQSWSFCQGYRALHGSSDTEASTQTGHQEAQLSFSHFKHQAHLASSISPHQKKKGRQKSLSTHLRGVTWHEELQLFIDPFFCSMTDQESGELGENGVENRTRLSFPLRKRKKLLCTILRGLSVYSCSLPLSVCVRIPLP